MLLCRFRLDKDMKRESLLFLPFFACLQDKASACCSAKSSGTVVDCNYSSSLSELLFDFPTKMVLKTQKEKELLGSSPEHRKSIPLSRSRLISNRTGSLICLTGLTRALFFFFFSLSLIHSTEFLENDRREEGGRRLIGVMVLKMDMSGDFEW